MKDPLGTATLQRMIEERDRAVALAGQIRFELAQAEQKNRDILRMLAVLVRRAITAANEAAPEGTIPEDFGVDMPWTEIAREGPNPSIFFRRNDADKVLRIRVTPFPGQKKAPPKEEPKRSSLILPPGVGE